MVTQTAFFKLTGVLPFEESVVLLKDAIKKTYGRKGDAIVNMNCAAVDKAVEVLHEVQVPAEWANAEDAAKAEKRCANEPEFIKNILPSNDCYAR